MRYSNTDNLEKDLIELAKITKALLKEKTSFITQELAQQINKKKSQVPNHGALQP